MKFLGFAASALAVVAMVLALSTPPVDAKHTTHSSNAVGE